MNPARIALDNRTTTLVLTFAMIVGGLLAYQNLGRLEDPEFTIKDALVITPYPGASAQEVEEEVTDEIELAAQKLGQLKEIESRSERGLSTVTVTMKDKYDKAGLPQVWDELRRKIGDAQGSLPPGAGPSIVVDDFGDVYGIFIAIYGNDFSYAELEDYADFLRREFLLVEDVAKIEFYGTQREVIYIEMDRDRLSQLGIPTNLIVRELQKKNVAAYSGRVQVGPDYITIDPTGTVTSVEDLESTLIAATSGASTAQIYLRDVATVRRGYAEPAKTLLRFDGHAAIGLGISTIADGNVVAMGEALRKRFVELEQYRPLGIEFGIIALQSDAVNKAINSFVISLIEAILIVVVVLLFFMGMRSGLLIGFILFLTIAGTFILMGAKGVTLERISLGALIIALGMLVDNAIVVVDGMLVRIGKGEDRVKAAIAVVGQTSWPLLGATFVAVLAFAAIGTSQDKTGEYCRSLFQVILFSLMLSWVTAVTVTPLLCILFLKGPESAEDDGEAKDPYGGIVYSLYRTVLKGCIRFRTVTLVTVLVIFVASGWGFRFIPQSFFPDSTRPQFMVDFWLAQGTHIDETRRQVEEIESYLRTVEGITHVTSMTGQGALRFLLTYGPERPNSAYAQFLVDVDDFRKLATLLPEVQSAIETRFPDSVPTVRQFVNGPGEPGKVQARIMGPDLNVLRRLSAQVEAIMHAEPDAFGIRVDWRERVKVIRPVLAENQANLNGITRPDVANALRQGFEGLPVGVYREGDKLLPIVARAPGEERGDVAAMQNLQIWSPAAGKRIPIRQVVSSFETGFEDEIIFRQDRKRTITVLCDPRAGNANVLFANIRKKVEEEVDIPVGYELQWWGEYKSSNDSKAALAGSLPLFFSLMVLVVITLFNALRTPLIIWLTVPLALIGVTFGLLVTGQSFGFMAMLGFLSLSGMLVKNAIVLIDQINLEIGEGKHPFDAIVDSCVSRLRPVSMAAATTILGMLPLLQDAFFISMAVTICFGLGFATVLTMLVVPVFYAVFFRVPYRAE